MARFIGMVLSLLISAGFFLHAAEPNPVPSELQKKLIGHWVVERNSKLHTYYSYGHRMVERDVPNNDSAFFMMDYRVWEEWPELRTLIVNVDEGGQFTVMLVITFSEDFKSAVCREKSLTAWSRSFKLQRVDDNTHPAKLPEKIKLLDSDSGLGQQ